MKKQGEREQHLTGLRAFVLDWVARICTGLRAYVLDWVARTRHAVSSCSRRSRNATMPKRQSNPEGERQPLLSSPLVN